MKYVNFRTLFPFPLPLLTTFTKSSSHVFSFTMKTTLIALAGLSLGLGNSFALDATLTDDVSIFVGQLSPTYYPYASRLRVDENNIALLKFDIASVIPAGTAPTDVKKAVIKVWVNPSRDFISGGCLLKKVTSNWTEFRNDSLTSKVPTFGANFGSVAVYRRNSFITFDITSLVQEWVSGSPNFGVALYTRYLVVPAVVVDNPSLAHPCRIWIDSKENKATAHEPTLQIVLNGN